jgi:thioredoxin reductase (NADPH)
MSSDTTLYGAVWCPACRRTKKFLQEQRVPFTWVDLDLQPEASDVIAALNGGTRSIPTLVLGDGSVLIAPSNEELANALGIDRTTLRDVYDLVIVGGGPAGLTTAIYGARENLDVLVLDRGGLGGQAGVTERFDNYPGFPEGVGGAELADRIIEQARRYGVELLPAIGVSGLERDGDEVVVRLSTGAGIRSAAVLAATGSTYRRLGVPGEADLIGAGIHFCATCDGPFYRDADEVLVIGGGNSGLEEGLFLTQFARKVTVVEFGDALGGSRLLQERVLGHPQMEVLTGTAVRAFVGAEAGKLEGVVLVDRATGAEQVRRVPGAFVFIGLDPNTAFLPDTIERDERGFIATGPTMETSLPGVFAAGDVRAGSTKQLASAVGEGAAAALQIRHHLDSRARLAGVR